MARLRDIWLPVGIAAVMGGVGYAAWRAQAAGEDALQQHGTPYLDALVAGDWQAAAAVDHPSRELTAADLEQAYTRRQAELGDLTRWSLVVSNPGRDPDGAFVLATTHLHFAGADDPVPLRVELREGPDGVYQVARAAPTSKRWRHEPVW